MIAGGVHSEGKKYFNFKELAEMGRQLVDDPCFMRIHKSFTVNLECVSRVKTIEGAADITRMTTDPARRYLYVVNSGANKVQVIDLATDTLIREMPGGAFPVDIAFKPL